MKITVRFFTHLREIAGRREETIEVPLTEKADLFTILRILSQKYGKEFDEYVYDQKTGKVRGYLQLLVNGRSISDIGELNAKLEDGDVLAIVPPVGGG